MKRAHILARACPFNPILSEAEGCPLSSSLPPAHPRQAWDANERGFSIGDFGVTLSSANHAEQV